MKRIKSFFDKHMVFCWAILSLIVALIIHICFKIEVRYKWFIVKWTAGDIMTYISTVSLGLLAVWQNKKYKEQSEESQARLERISLEANELNVIQKIIDKESRRLSTIKIDINKLINYCKSNSFELITDKSEGKRTKKIEGFTELEKRIDDVFNRLKIDQRLSIFNEKDNIEQLADVMNELVYETKNLLILLKKNPSKYCGEDMKRIDEINEKFTIIVKNYLLNEDEKLNSVIYGEMSLEEVKKLYRTH